MFTVCGRYTSKKSSSGISVYAITLTWPKGGELFLAAVTSTSQTTVSMLGYEPSIKWSSHGPAGGIVLHLPAVHEDQMPCQWAWVFKLNHVSASGV